MDKIPELFASAVFSDSVMRERLPKDTYNTLKAAIEDGGHIENGVADIVARVMKEWAVEKGATHFTHWFHPMTGFTAEKHDAFLRRKDGKVIMDFSGKELVRGEPDASSFPSGGLRAVFEARGYTAWDPTSYAFIKNGTLCIPTTFCSYSGEALDKKTPLLRSMEALNRQAMRILKLFGNNTAKKVISAVGVEQEYFLVDKYMYHCRPDLIFCGRTLFGARPPKGQELSDHYFGAINERVAAFMKELDLRLWEMGVLVKTKHNEAAPGQHEIVPLFNTVNLAADDNQIIMEFLKNVAAKHDLACLLHEKPFKGVSGSGKHNNWSLSTDSGVNLLDPGETPERNAQFLLFLMAVITAVDKYQDMLRASCAHAGNDHRLGAHEAPPTLISIYLGDELTQILEAIENNSVYKGKEKIKMQIGISTLPEFAKDTTDRNRTSSFAFTGNRFEFRMPGASSSPAGPNIIINTAVAEALCGFADILEGAKDFNTALSDLIKTSINEHKRVIFNGNGYSEEWHKEAEKRGLLNLATTVDALPAYLDNKNISVFKKHGVFSENEMRARYEIMSENYCKTLHIEALTLIDMVNKEILPAVFEYQNILVQAVKAKDGLFGSGANDGCAERQVLGQILPLTDKLHLLLSKLESCMPSAKSIKNHLEAMLFYRDTVLKLMNDMRDIIDVLETITAKKCWPYPYYSEIIFSVSN